MVAPPDVREDVEKWANPIQRRPPWSETARSTGNQIGDLQVKCGKLRDRAGAPSAGYSTKEQPPATTVPERAGVQVEGRARHGALERRLGKGEVFVPRPE